MSNDNHIPQADVKELQYLREKGTSEAEINSLRGISGAGTPPATGTVPIRDGNAFIAECESVLARVTGGAESTFPWYPEGE